MYSIANQQHFGEGVCMEPPEPYGSNGKIRAYNKDRSYLADTYRQLSLFNDNNESTSSNAENLTALLEAQTLKLGSFHLPQTIDFTKNLTIDFPISPAARKAGFQGGAIYQGDCLEKMRKIEDRSVDLILCDLPYGTTQNKWDSVIPLKKLWKEYERIIGPKGVIALTSQGIFTAKLMLSKEDWFKYKFVWVKSKPTNFLNARRQPLRQHEDICIFYPNQPDYRPVMSQGEPYNKGIRKAQFTGSYGDFKPVEVKSDGERFPTDTLYCKTAESEAGGRVWHPTQKPVALGRYLIRMFTAPGNVVLDNAFGSGSFLVAAALEGRKFIGIEKNEQVQLFKGNQIDYLEVAKFRINEALESVIAGKTKPPLYSDLQPSVRISRPTTKGLVNVDEVVHHL